MHIALLTFEKHPELPASEAPLLAALERRGFTVRTAPWTSKRDWSAFDVAIPKLCWDYFERYEEFLSFLDHLDESGVTLVNPKKTITWNADKKYLLDLSHQGIDVAPFQLLEPENRANLQESIQKWGYTDLVIKPTISAGSNETRRFVDQPEEAQKFAQSLASHKVLMVQPFIPEIVEMGEISLIYVGSQFSHGAIKKPKNGDFRSQPEFGSSITPYEPPPSIKSISDRLVQTLPHDQAYCRVDGYISQGKFRLMELELIEPYFYFEFGPEEAIEKCADALAAMFHDRRN